MESKKGPVVFLLVMLAIVGIYFGGPNILMLLIVLSIITAPIWLVVWLIIRYNNKVH